jgi:hypothetical protein
MLSVMPARRTEMDAALTQQAKTRQPIRNFRQEALKARSAYIGEIIGGGVPAARRAIKVLGCSFAVAAAAFWGTMLTSPAATMAEQVSEAPAVESTSSTLFETVAAVNNPGALATAPDAPTDPQIALDGYEDR